ncbi:hypothetical protein PC120_g11097 [Phytophthora cactorum]|nr:hypothetical protein PC120_g11097 [Phytophthora cactorum]
MTVVIKEVDMRHERLASSSETPPSSEDPTEVIAVSVACLFNTTGNRDMESTQGCLESVHTAALHAIAA